ncbi:hypothetical protein LIER_38369 [Lithospermum erythrorhizon]|uniref:Uncharacterized protein n=1 Tax=Lithospermum erythrorhizon TaxID=34254 RepID=A0AAV3Q0B5_LITER
MAGQVDAKDSPFNDETFRIAYEKTKNYFSARIHYGGKLLANPIFYYDAGEVELFGYCDADTFEVGSVDAWAFRVGLRFGDLLHVYINILKLRVLMVCFKFLSLELILLDI